MEQCVFISFCKIILNGFSGLLYRDAMVHPTFTLVCVIRHNHFPGLDEFDRITATLYLAERSVYMHLICSFAAK